MKVLEVSSCLNVGWEKLPGKAVFEMFSTPLGVFLLSEMNLGKFGKIPCLIHQFLEGTVLCAAWVGILSRLEGQPNTQK